MGVKVSKFWFIPPVLVLAYGTYLFNRMDGDSEIAASEIPEIIVPE